MNERPSPATVVWGVTLLGIAAWAAAVGFLGWRADPVLVGSGLVGLAGLILVVLAAVGSSRSRTARRTPDHTPGQEPDEEPDEEP